MDFNDIFWKLVVLYIAGMVTYIALKVMGLS